jgi:Prohead core protein serine protease
MTLVRIKESATSSPLTVESKKVLSGPFAELDVFNNNGRRYPRPIYESAYTQVAPKIPQRRLLGELDHPLEYDEVRLANVSHVITECEINSDGVVSGKVELLDTPAGKVAQALVECGVPLGISSRGLGATKKLTEGVEVTKLKLITFDLVAEPSFGNAILEESKFNGLHESLSQIEETLPLNESESDDDYKPVRDMITQIRENVKVKPVSETEDALKLLENEILSEVTDESLKESIQLQGDQISTLESLVEARTQEVAVASKLIENQQRIIDQLKSKVKTAVATGDVSGLAELMESVGNLSIAIAQKEVSLQEKDSRLSSLEENMTKLQEQYNVTVEALNSKTGNSEALNEEVVTLRKKLALESKGLSWKKYSPLLEGLTTEREIQDKLSSISHLSNGSRGHLDEKKVVRTLTESTSATSKSSRLSDIVSRV